MLSIFPLLTKTQIESLENVQKLCTKMHVPNSGCDHERLYDLSLPPFALFSENYYWTHFFHSMSDEHHSSTVVYLRGSLRAAAVLLEWRQYFSEIQNIQETEHIFYERFG